MNNTTYMAKNNEVESKWYIIDASQKPLGRVAAEAAKLLRGKHKPTFTPNQDTGDHVIILNCKDVILTGKKLDQNESVQIETLVKICNELDCNIEDIVEFIKEEQ